MIREVQGMSKSLIEASKTAGQVAFAIILFTVLFVVFCVAHTSVRKHDEQQIAKWGAKEEYQVVSVTVPFTHPFWFSDDDDRIYYVELNDNGKAIHCYFKFNMFGMKQSWSGN